MIIHRGLDRVLANLGKAISGKHVAIFHNNASACAGVYKDFTVEPFKMDINSVNVAALDLRSGRNKIFKVARIGGVEVLPEIWTREKEHKYPELDVFRMSGKSPSMSGWPWPFVPGTCCWRYTRYPGRTSRKRTADGYSTARSCAWKASVAS